MRSTVGMAGSLGNGQCSVNAALMKPRRSRGDEALNLFTS